VNQRTQRMSCLSFDVVEKICATSNNIRSLSYKSFTSCHPVILSSCHPVILSSCLKIRFRDQRSPHCAHGRFSGMAGPAQ
jgi:hypothetical protein